MTFQLIKVPYCLMEIFLAALNSIFFSVWTQYESTEITLPFAVHIDISVFYLLWSIPNALFIIAESFVVGILSMLESIKLLLEYRHNLLIIISTWCARPIFWINDDVLVFLLIYLMFDIMRALGRGKVALSLGALLVQCLIFLRIKRDFYVQTKVL